MALAKQIGVGVALLVMFYAGWLANGWRLGQDIAEIRQDLAEERQTATQQARTIETQRQDLADAQAAEYEAKRQAVAALSEINTVEVVKYVEAPYSGKCDLPVGWVRIDTATAAGVPPDTVPTSGSDGAPSGFTDADSLRVIRKRNEICRSEIDKVRGLQQYVNNLQLEE